MIVFSAITPHSPLLLDSINKDHLERVAKTRKAMNELAEEFYASHPDVIVLISEHPTGFTNSFSINVADPFTFDLSEFGDLGFEKTFKPDLMLIDRLQRSLRKNDQPITLTTDESLHYASAVPLQLLTDNLKSIPLIPITYSDLSPKEHFQFGQALKDVFSDTNKRIAIIVSGDMSHALHKDAPSGFHEAGKEFDEIIQAIITTKNTAGLLNLDPELIKNAHQTIYLPLCILFGLIDHVATTSQLLSYESPFHVGYLVANVQMK